MPQWAINDTVDVLGLVGICAMLIAGVVIILLKRKILFGRKDKTILEIEQQQQQPNDNQQQPIAPTDPPTTINCPYVLEHSQKLDSLERSIRAMRKEVKVLYKLMNPIILTLKANLELAIGNQQNGQVSRAFEAISDAEELFKTTLIDKIDENS